MMLNKLPAAALLLVLTSTASAAEPATPPATETLATIPVDPPAQPAPPVAAEQEPAGLETIVVTAQKREENLQDVPISIQAFSSQALENLDISDQFSLQQAVPGLDVNSIAQFTTIFLRGVGSDAFLMADPSVASYVDGIYFPFAQGLDQDFGAVDSVEVLKGPQGTLFGRNAVGGAISVHTRNPDFGQPETSLQAQFGDRETTNLRLYQNVPLTDWLAINLAGYYNRADNYYTGTANGEPLPREISRGVRGKIRLQPLDSLDIVLSGLHVDQQGVGSAYQLNAEPLPLFTLACALPVATPLCIQPQKDYDGALSEASFLNFDNTVFYGEATWKAPWFDVKLLGSNQSAESAFTYDFDGSPNSLAAFDQKRNFANVDTAELQLLSNDDTPGSDRFSWIVGGYYFNSVQGFDTANLQLAGLDLADQRPGGISLPPLLVDLLDQADINIPNGDVAFHAIIGTLSKSAFAQATLRATDWLSLTAGARYQDERRNLIRSDSGLYLADGGFQTLFNWNEIGARDADGNRVPTTDTTTSFKPKFAVELRPFDHDTLIYASYQEALKSATYNAVAIYLPPAFVKPEELEAYEVGLKTTLFNGTVQFNIAAFDYSIKNFQVQFISLLQGGAVSFENADAASIQGVDFDARMQILPKTFDRLILSFGGAFLDGRYDKYTDASGFDTTPTALFPQGSGLFRSDNDYSGNRVVRTPKFTGVAALNKSWNAPGGLFEAGADIYYNGGFFYTSSNDPRFEQKSYAVFGARLSYLYSAWGVRTTIFGRNLGDQKYTQGLIATDFGGNFTLAPPLTYGLRINWDF